MFIHDGMTVDYRPGADVAAGDVIVQGDLVGVARRAIKSGELGALAVYGVFDFPKATGVGTDAAAGTPFYWDADPGVAVESADSGANKRIGLSLAAVTTADTKVRVLLSN